MKEEFSEELISWAEKVIDVCTPVAEEFNLEYYPLQSRVKSRPTFLFIGLNPGGGYGYDSQKGNPAWQFDFLKSRLTAQRVLLGNPAFDNGFHNGKWKYGRGLSKIPFLRESIKNYDFVFANYIFYSSKTCSEINKKELKNSIEENISLTKKLIEIIKPKFIIVLGTEVGLTKYQRTINCYCRVSVKDFWLRVKLVIFQLLAYHILPTITLRRKTKR